MKPFKLAFIPAYKVDGWATELKLGWASKEIIKNDYGSNSVLFTADKISYTIETLSSTHYIKGVFTDEGLALRALKYQRDKYIEYLEKEVKESTEKLKELKP